MPLDPYFTSSAKIDQASFKLDDPQRPPADQWPRLSKDLPFPRRPDTCQACGRKPDALSMSASDKIGWMKRWVEHDEKDRPEKTIVVLCPSCSRRLVEPHPRLYHRLPAYKPVPGAIFHLCSGCVHCVDLKCTHPDLKENGGAGLVIKCRPPARMFVDSAGKNGKRTGWVEELWSEPAESCAGRKLK